MLICCFFLFTTFPSGLLGGTKRGFKDYTEYEPGNMSLIITAPHGGELTPSKQENGDPWPDRTAGCLGSSGCIWKHSCGEVDAEKCPAITESDLFTATVARDMADGIKTITGKTHMGRIVNPNSPKVSLCKDVFERCTSTGSGLFSFGDGGFAKIF